MEECDVETIIQRAREAYPDARPRIISDNGPQFIAKDFKEFIRQAGMTHVKTSPYYPHQHVMLDAVEFVRVHQSRPRRARDKCTLGSGTANFNLGRVPLGSRQTLSFGQD
jgi:hypothetical protein